MPRILYMSDLHLEMERWRLSVPGWASFLERHRAAPAHPSRGPMLTDLEAIDLVILAGDIHNGLRGIVYAEQVAKYLAAPVVYVAGNHEFYHQSMDLLLPASFKAAEHSAGRVHFLENSVASFEFSGQRINILGCTLWTDFELNGDAQTAMRIAERRMNDYVYIHCKGNRFAPDDGLTRHQKSRLWLHKTLARLHRREPGAKNIIVTHHAPSPAFLGARTGEIAPAYASDMALEFAHMPPAIWVHGHTHCRHDSVEEGIRFVSAPRGYVIYDGDDTLNYRPGLLEL